MSEIFGTTCALDAFQSQESAIEDQRTVFEAMLVASEDSGKDATGVLFIGRDEKDSKGAMFKIDLPAREFMKRDEYIELGHKFYGKSLRTVIGHCRKASPGAPADNKHNNHPINSRAVVGSHVGSITNHESLWKDHGGNMNHAQRSVWRSGDVDSEIIFFLMGKALRARDCLTFEGSIVEASKLLKGTYACAAVDLWRTKYVMLFTNQKKIHYYYSPSLNQTLFSTSIDVLQAALVSKGFTLLEDHKEHVPAHSGLRINADTMKLRPFVLASEEVTNTEVKNIVVRNTGAAGFGL